MHHVACHHDTSSIGGAERLFRHVATSWWGYVGMLMVSSVVGQSKKVRLEVCYLAIHIQRSGRYPRSKASFLGLKRPF